jgi:hypothetical protein
LRVLRATDLWAAVILRGGDVDVGGGVDGVLYLRDGSLTSALLLRVSRAAVGVGLVGDGTARAASVELAVLAELAVSVLLAVRTLKVEAYGRGLGLLCSRRRGLGGNVKLAG